MPKSVPACTKRFCEGRFGEHVSIGGYASAGFAEAVKMPCAEAQGASLLSFYRVRKDVYWFSHFIAIIPSFGYIETTPSRRESNR
jgi:hypothetical protein